MPKSKLIKTLSNKNNNNNLMVNLSINKSKVWTTFKKSSFIKINKNEIDDKLKRLNKKSNYYSYISLNKSTIFRTINDKKEKKKNNFNDKKFTIKSTKNLNNLRMIKNLKDNLSINKKDTNINENTFSKLKKKLEDIKLTKNLKINKNINLSKKKITTSFPSPKRELLSKIVSSAFIKKSKYKKNNLNYLNIKNRFILNHTIEINEKETNEYESKFINYELGLSDKTRSSLNITLDNNKKNKDNIKKEYEKPFEELEKIANEKIINSNHRKRNFKKKIISNNNQKINRNISIYNDDIEELKNGEEIQKVLDLFISKNNNNKFNIKK